MLANSRRSDDDIAAEVGCKPKVVAIARKALQNKGRIPKPDTSADPAVVASKVVCKAKIAREELARWRAELN